MMETHTAVPLSALQRLHMFEDQRMNRLEERILAWHLDVEATKVKPLLTIDSQVWSNNC